MSEITLANGCIQTPTQIEEWEESSLMTNAPSKNEESPSFQQSGRQSPTKENSPHNGADLRRDDESCDSSSAFFQNGTEVDENE